MPLCHLVAFSHCFFFSHSFHCPCQRNFLFLFLSFVVIFNLLGKHNLQARTCNLQSRSSSCPLFSLLSLSACHTPAIRLSLSLSLTHSLTLSLSLSLSPPLTSQTRSLTREFIARSFLPDREIVKICKSECESALILYKQGAFACVCRGCAKLTNG